MKKDFQILEILRKKAISMAGTSLQGLPWLAFHLRFRLFSSFSVQAEVEAFDADRSCQRFS